MNVWLKIATISITVFVVYKYTWNYLHRWRRFNDVHDDGGWLAIDTPMPHNLKIGDSVLIEQDKPIFGSSCVEVRLADPNYNGVAIVTKIPSDKVFVLNKKFTNKNPYQIGSFKLNTSFSKI